MYDEKRIRQRRSYKSFKDWLKFLNRQPKKENILKRLFRELDSRHSFGSIRHAEFAKESLMLVIKDNRL